MISISKPYIDEVEKQAVLDVLESGMLAQGRQVVDLEEKFAEICGVKHAVATSSGTTALHTALLAHDVGPGDEVITTPFTFIASVNSIIYTGATPVFVDIDERSFNIDESLVEEAITSRTKAIMPVHLYGQVCGMDVLQELASKYGLTIIEDACQSIGATFKGQKAGSFGTGAFSLYATKNIMSAEGGMITTDDGAVAERGRLLRNHGMKRRYYYDFLGYNYRMTNIHAAIGLAQIGRLSRFNQRRRENAQYYNENIHSVITPSTLPYREHVWHQYTVRLNGNRNRDEVVEKLHQAGIGTGIFYPVPAHGQGYVRKITGEIKMPIAERVSEEVFSLPVHPHLSQDDLDKVVDEVNKL